MNNAYLLIGGNDGDRHASLAAARNFLSVDCGKILQRSAVYETAAWGNTRQPAFLNQSLFISTPLAPDALMKTILGIEEKMGRVRTEKYGQRKIDIDILFYNDALIREPGLIIPHPEIANRRFVLEPLNEIAPDFIHPALHQPISTLLAICPDQLAVQKL